MPKLLVSGLLGGTADPARGRAAAHRREPRLWEKQETRHWVLQPKPATLLGCVGSVITGANSASDCLFQSDGFIEM